MQRRNRYDETLEKHWNILECLRAGDALKARQAMLDHLLVTYRSMMRHMKQSELEGKKNEN